MLVATILAAITVAYASETPETVAPSTTPINIFSSLANAPWPMFRHDVQHTGRSTYAGPQAPQLEWNYKIGGSVHSSPAIGADGTIYVGSSDGNLYAINPTGSLKWSYTTGGYIIYSSPAIGADGTIYVGSDDGLYAINPTGSLKWSYITRGSVHSSPAIGADGTIYVGSSDHHLYAINPTGSLKWSYTMGGFIYHSPTIGADGTIYLSSDDGNLYAIGDRKPEST